MIEYNKGFKVDFIINTLFGKSHNLDFNYGPSFQNGLVDPEEWETFKKNIKCENSAALTDLWHKKADVANGVPNRKDFRFEDLVKFGSNLYLAKLTEDNRWLTTFCGEGIVNTVGFDASSKYIDEFGPPELLEYWLKNLKELTDHSKPFMEYYTLEFANREFIHCSSINLPLKSEGSDFPDIVMTHEAYSAESSIPSFQSNFS